MRLITAMVTVQYNWRGGEFGELEAVSGAAFG
jgi:hypothetical protein